jgi:hypothetical protein
MVVSLLFGHLVPLSGGRVGRIRLGLSDDIVSVVGGGGGAGSCGHDVSGSRPRDIFLSLDLARIHE